MRNPRRATVLLLLTLLPLAGPSLRASEEPTETAEQRAERLRWWRDAKFGLFIHWGVYAVPAGQFRGQPAPGAGEWIMLSSRIPVAEYRAFARDFRPTKYDPEAWAALAEEAGMKYVVITAKHHDGFALYPSDVTDWDVADATPNGKDLLTPLAEAVRRRGLKFGTYYSQAQDWTHPGGAKMGMPEGGGWDEAQKGSFDDYLRTIAVPQTREILTRIQPDILWWDTPVGMTAERARPLHDLIALRPGLITNDRLGGGFDGDSATPEQHIPATGLPGRDWETCMTMNDTWGYKRDDANWKSPETLIRNLVDIVSKGGNYLLNVGPTAEGEIPAESVERLKAVGRWMKVNGASIYGTTASPFRSLPWGRCTRKGNTLYLHVFQWPATRQLDVPLARCIASAHLLADPGHTLTVTSSEGGVGIALPERAPDPIETVVVLEVEGEVTPIEIPVKPEADGRLVLRAADGRIEGSTARIEGDAEPNIGYWTNAGDAVSWRARPAGAIRHRVELVAACEPGSAGSTVEVTIGDRTLSGTIPATGSWRDYRPIPLGEIRVDGTGPLDVRVRATRKPGEAVMNLRAVVLTPIRD